MARPLHLSHRRPARFPALPVVLFAGAFAQLADAFLSPTAVVIVAVGLVLLAMVVVAVRRASRTVDTILTEELGPRLTLAPSGSEEVERVVGS